MQDKINLLSGVIKNPVTISADSILPNVYMFTAPQHPSSTAQHNNFGTDIVGSSRLTILGLHSYYRL